VLQNTPKKIDGLRQIVDLAVGHDVVYTIDRAGTLSVFGTNSYGEGGDGLVTPLPALMAIGLPTKAKQVVVNRGYTVVLLDDATLRQWAAPRWRRSATCRRSGRSNRTRLVPSQTSRRSTRSTET